MAFTVGMACRAMEKFSALVEENKDYLTDLDSAIGDADHGVNMNRGVTLLMEKMRENSYADFGRLFRDVAMTIMSAVGGSAGPLYGTFFMKLGQDLSEQNTATMAELAEAMRDGVNSLMSLGKSAPGDKTMLDTLVPAVEALTAGVNQEQGDVWNAVTSAAKQGMEGTIPMLAKRGRSSYLGERSIGHQDPGATSSFYLIAAFRDAALEK